MSFEEKKKTESKEKDKALSLVLGQIERNFGRGSIMRLGDASRMKVETISTGALTLDLALGGGYPKGRVVEVYGPESSGKTTLTLHAIAEVQKNGGVAAFVDAEHALDPVYAASLGVDVEIHACGPAHRILMSAIRNTNYYEVALVGPDCDNAIPPVYLCGYSDMLDCVDDKGFVDVPDGEGLGVVYDWSYINKNKTHFENFEI